MLPGDERTVGRRPHSSRQQSDTIITYMGADARALPFANDSFDLVFFQNTLMWIDPPCHAIAECARVLKPDGVLVALEPDYGGMIEEPNLGLRVVWLDALERAGADPLVGRRLPGLAEEAGLEPWVEFAHIPRPAEPEALDLLAELPLTVLQRERVQGAREIILRAPDDWSVLLHVPWVMVVACA
jgi:SAM-dependent methyltransferase